MGELIRIRGRVQGVGFRPTVARVARARGLAGFVRNDADGVLVGLAADAEAVDAFLAALDAALPPLARVTAVERAAHDVRAEGFAITGSEGGAPSTEVAPDAATCEACAREVADPAARRHRYPFTSCTHCGPRFSIVEAIPYDRARTTMARFPMCDACRAEYEDEADRRYHAQPLACPACGPRARFRAASGEALGDDALRAAAALVRDGGVLALKGLGGWQLVCDATDPAAVRRLRERKRRPHKALALMARDLEAAARLVMLDEGARAVLTSPEAPIVLLDRRPEAPIAPEVAPDQRRLGVMLPTSPLHALLLDGVARPVVCTSGNLTEDPPLVDDAEAHARLAAVADGFLGHDRPIANRVDDSVVAFLDGEARVLRRARGYAPASLPLPPGFEDAPPLLALGGDDKATFALVDGGRARLSPHLGDLANPDALAAYEKALALLEAMTRHRPRAVAVDAHPGYRSHALGRALARARGVPFVPVLHHHAHIAACLAENGWPRGAGPVLGLALDGLGAGEGGALWGGELLLVHYARCERLGGLKATPLIGGDRAAREPWRNLYAHLVDGLGWEALTRGHRDTAAFETIAARRTPLIDRMLETGARAPRASSTGRLFDAVAAALGLFPDAIGYEGQAAMALEGLVEPGAPAPPPYPFAIDDGTIDPAPMWRALLADLAAGAEPAVVAARFHRGLADALVRLSVDAARRHAVDVVALSGGCLQNRVLVEGIARGLRAAGLRVLAHREVPPNDACLALGQAVVALAAGG